MFGLHLPHGSLGWDLIPQKIAPDKSDGLIEVPKGAGLGIEIDRGELERVRGNTISR